MPGDFSLASSVQTKEWFAFEKRAISVTTKLDTYIDKYFLSTNLDFKSCSVPGLSFSLSSQLVYLNNGEIVVFEEKE